METTRGARLAGMIGTVVGAMLLVACAGPEKPDNDATGDGEPSARRVRTPRAPRISPDSAAAQLLAAGITIAGAGFSVREPLRCLPPENVEDWQRFCRVLLADAERRGENAQVDIRLFDRDISFAEQDASVRAHVDSIPHEYVLDTKPPIRFTSPAGVERWVEVACHQALGRRNGPAYCAMLVNSRTMIVAGVRPLRRSTTTLTLGENKTPNQDVNRAADLAGMAALKLPSLFPD